MKKHISLSISGFDGSGKSTQVAILSRELKERGYTVQVKSGFQYFLLRSIIRSGRKVRKDALGGPVKRNKNPLLSLFSLVALIDMWAFHLLKVIPLLRASDYVIYDRAALDQAVALVYYGFLPKSLLAFYVKFIPKMQFPILLKVTPEEAFIRSREFHIDYYKKQFDLYEVVRKNTNIFTCDGTDSIDKISTQILKVISTNRHV